MKSFWSIISVKNDAIHTAGHVYSDH